MAEFAALYLEAFDMNEALLFRSFVLRICTLYTVKKEAPIGSPHFISQIPLINDALAFGSRGPSEVPMNESDAALAS